MAFTTIFAARGQNGGAVPTQVLVNVDAKSAAPASAAAVTVTVNGKKQPLIAWDQVTPANAQVALLIDDDLAGTALSGELDNLRSFVRTLPAGVEITVGYMHHNEVGARPFTANHEFAASTVRLPQGMAGLDSNPYVCISFFVRNWAAYATPVAGTSAAAAPSPHKARFILMVTDGVDPTYSKGQAETSVADLRNRAAETQAAATAEAHNMQPGMALAPGVQTQLLGQQQTAQAQLQSQQDQVEGKQAVVQESPFVVAAVEDAERAGVAVSEIYYSNSARTGGVRYLTQVTQRTGGTNYFEGGAGNPTSTAPFLQQFQRAIAQTYVATFNSPMGNKAPHDLVRLKFSADNTKLHAPDEARPGNLE
jgi:hypothetical protein